MIITPPSPRLYVGGIVSDGVRVLLGRRSVARERYPGVWDIFGGHIEHGEDARTALNREMHEELGIEVLEAKPVGRLSGTSNPDPAPFVMEVFLVCAWSALPRISNPEHDSIRWFFPQELDALVGIIDERLPAFVRTALRKCAHRT